MPFSVLDLSSLPCSFASSGSRELSSLNGPAMLLSLFLYFFDYFIPAFFLLFPLSYFSSDAHISTDVRSLLHLAAVLSASSVAFYSRHLVDSSPQLVAQFIHLLGVCIGRIWVPAFVCASFLVALAKSVIEACFPKI